MTHDKECFGTLLTFILNLSLSMGLAYSPAHKYMDTFLRIRFQVIIVNNTWYNLPQNPSQLAYVLASICYGLEVLWGDGHPNLTSKFDHDSEG